jgi:hypothetical protein
VKLIPPSFGFEAGPISNFDFRGFGKLIQPTFPRRANGFWDDFVPIDLQLPDFLNDDF